MAAVIILMMSLIGVIDYRHARDSLEKSLKDSITTTKSRLAKSLAFPIYEFDETLLDELNNIELTNPSIKALTVFDGENE